jgi:hypothetical protein
VPELTEARTSASWQARPPYYHPLTFAVALTLRNSSYPSRDLWERLVRTTIVDMVGKRQIDFTGGFRVLLGFVSLVLGLSGAAFALFILVVSRAMGAGGDGFQRFLVGYALVVVLLIFVAAFCFSSWSIRSLVRRRVFWALSAGFIAAVLWAAFGIDSTRSVRSLPEAVLVVPGADEESTFARPADGGLNSPARAEFVRTMVTDQAIEEVEEYFRTALAERGWEYVWTFGSVSGDRYLNWDRDGFTLQLRLPDPVAPSSKFSYAIFGPEQ